MAKIEHVSDTALMVAACRAMETVRPDGLVRDPFAASLADEKGMAIAKSSSGMEWMSFAIGIRSHFIDDLLASELQRGGIETVLNLGAGLDTRPWRMDLPSGLRWIEADYPDMIAYKRERLGDARPRCALEQIAADLSVASERERVFRGVAGGSTLMMTEGVLMYLSRSSVEALAGDAKRARVNSWIFDVSGMDLMRPAHGDLVNAIESVRAEGHLNARETVEVAVSSGWEVAEHCSYTRDCMRVAEERIMNMVRTMDRLPQGPPPDDPSGVYLLRRKG